MEKCSRTTVTHSVAALQMKLLHVILWVVKFREVQSATIQKGKDTLDPREKLKTMENAVYGFIGSSLRLPTVGGRMNLIVSLRNVTSSWAVR